MAPDGDADVSFGMPSNLSRRTFVKGTCLGAFAPLVLQQAFARAQIPSDIQAQQAHARGVCGSLGPGTGLRGGRGWVVSMLPGKHEFRARGGEVYLTAARFKSSMDFDVGRPYFIAVEAAPDSVLEWRILDSDWGPVSKFFLYPPTG